MRFKFHSDTQRQIFIYSSSLIIAVFGYLVLSRMNTIFASIGSFIKILFPFILGFGIAFLLNGPVTWLEMRLTRMKFPANYRRIVSVVIMFLVLLAVIIFAIWIVIPNLLASVENFASSLGDLSARTESVVYQLSKDFELDYEELITALQSLNLQEKLSGLATKIISNALQYSVSVIHSLTVVVIALAAAFYMLMDKERLLRGIERLVLALTGRRRASFISLYSMDVKYVFQQYIVGSIFDALIVGIICWFGMMILHLPYVAMISFVIGLTNVIPMFGPFLGAIPCGIILFLINPTDCIIFLIFILILQQVDGNIFKPIILGDKLGLSGFWILFSVTVGGSLAGIAGMFLGVPIFALIYEAIKDWVDVRNGQQAA